MKILIVNAGSSSLKYQLVDMEGEKLMAKGHVERIGIAGIAACPRRDFPFVAPGAD